jgi:hypothetical protein
MEVKPAGVHGRCRPSFASGWHSPTFNLPQIGAVTQLKERLRGNIAIIYQAFAAIRQQLPAMKLVGPEGFSAPHQ